MKKLLFLILCVISLAGCSHLDDERLPDNGKDQTGYQLIEQGDEIEYLEDSLKNEVLNLRALWKIFDQVRRGDRDPTNDFKNSQYLLELKTFLSKRESLALSARQLGVLLDQEDYYSVDKMMTVGDRTVHMRVIGYNLNFYEQVMTDIPGIKNKWIFIQCWDEEAFYFSTLSDGDIHYFMDFMPLEINHKLHILITGEVSLYYPYPSFVWAFSLEEKGFYPSEIFDSYPYESKTYSVYSHARFDNSLYETKWMLHTNGSYLFAEKGKMDANNRINLIKITCEVDEAQKIITFISHDLEGEKTSIRLALIKGVFKVETDDKTTLSHE
jgi:hypothetical protein